MALVTVYSPEGVAQQVETVDAREMMRYNGYTTTKPEPLPEPPKPGPIDPPADPAVVVTDSPADPAPPAPPADVAKPWQK